MAIIVIEGLDGAGKSTQVKLLQEYLSKKGLTYEYLHFPRTDSHVFGDLVARFLRGELGEMSQVNPYLVAMIYAGDRADAKPLLEKWLENKVVVVLDRYVYSNIAYQCAKMAENKRGDLKKWILDSEYNYFKLPKPDLNIFLDVPFVFTQQKLTTQRTGSDRDYLQGQRDIHEENLDFQKQVREVYLSLESEANFVRIDCSNGAGEMLPAESIFEKIESEILSRSILK